MISPRREGVCDTRAVRQPPGRRRSAVLLALALAGAVGGCGAPPGGDPADASGAGDGGSPDAGPADAPVAAFAVQYADPDHGPFRGGTVTTIRGNGFREDDQVWIGGRRATDQRFIDSRRVEVATPPGDPGGAAIEVRRASGGDSAVRDDAFRYDAIAIDPPTGSVAGGTFITISGYGTAFDAATTVRIDGLPLSALTMENGQRLTGYTPPGIAGDADVDVLSSVGVVHVDRGFTYLATGDSFAGGFSGGPIGGTLNVVIIDQWTKDGIPGAFVAVGDPSTSPYRGTTNALGEITFSGPDLAGPVVVTAWAADHEVATFHCVDSENLSIWLRSPLPPPDGGPPPIGTNGALIRGSVMFGEATGLGSPYWDLVPEPRTPTERKRIYVTSASGGLTGQPIGPVAPIDYTGPDRLAWSYQVSARPGALAVVAIAGLYDPARDPTGQGNLGFEPFAMGVARGVLVGPGEDKVGVDIVVNIPLDAALRLELENPPALGSAGFWGPTHYRLRGGVDLGGEGVAHFGKHGLTPISTPEWLYPGEYLFPDGDQAITLTDVPALVRSVADGSYGMHVGAYSTSGGSPYSVRIVRGIHDGSVPVVVRDFIGVPRPLDPPASGVSSGRRVEFAPEAGTAGPATGVPTFHLHMMSDDSGNPVWRGITCEGVHAIELPDLSSIGVSWPPTGTTLSWTIWSIAGPGPYTQFTYRWMSSLYWRAYASASYAAQFPDPTPP
jgi:hypothetical protein